MAAADAALRYGRAVSDGLLGPTQIRALAAGLQLRPAKSLGQNFLHDPNTVRRIVRAADLWPDDVVLEVGPGLGSLTLGLLPACASVTAVEIDARLADVLPSTVDTQLPSYADRLRVVHADAARMAAIPGRPPTALVANLPYNVSVPVLLHLLGMLPSVRRSLVMVQAEVADRIAAPPGSRTYGAPSVKVAWFATARRAGAVPRSVFWPVPNVDSGLVALDRHPVVDGPTGVRREAVFAVVDAAFGQRRKMLRSALAGWAGSAAAATAVLTAAGVDPALRAEAIDVAAFSRIAAAGAAAAARQESPR